MQEYTQKELVIILSNAKSASGGTSLVTMGIPGEMSMSVISSQLNQELATSANIKSKSVKHDVQSALKSAINAIKFVPAMSPENGYLLCSGITASCI